MNGLRHERGTVSVEVLMVLVPLLLVFLGVTQLALFQVGHLVVTHAANRAVRSAVVVLDDDPKHYGGVKRYDLESGALSDQGGILGKVGHLNEAYGSLFGPAKVKGGARLTAIRQAAYHPLSVLAPALRVGSLEKEVAGSPWWRVGIYSKLYNRAAAAVTVEPSGPVGPREPITVRVNYLMKCGVPLVSHFMCHSGAGLLEGRVGLFSSKDARETMKALEPVASPVLRDAQLAWGGHYVLINAQATLPNQGAEYHED